MSGALGPVSVRRWCWRPPTAGTGLWMRCRPVVPVCTWPTRWVLRPLSTAGSRTTSATPPTWPTCCGWAACPRRGLRPRRRGSCVSWCGIGPTLGAVFVAEIGDITRFASAPKLTCWAGLTPKHHESDTHVHRGRITKQGSRLVRWAAIESVKRIPAGSPAGALRERVADRRGRNIGSVAAARRQLEFVFYALRDGHVRALEHLPRVA